MQYFDQDYLQFMRRANQFNQTPVMPQQQAMPQMQQGMPTMQQGMPIMQQPMPQMPAMQQQPMPPQQMPMQQPMAMPQQFAMPQQQLENLYPNTYNIIKPVVENVCDNMTANNGPNSPITNDKLESMVNEVYKKVEPNIEAEVKQKLPKEERQFYSGGRSLLRDFIAAMIITSLIGRRPFYGYSGFGYPGFYGGYGMGFPY